MAQWYKKFLQELIDVPNRVIEVRKEYAYQNNYKSKPYVVYAILSQSEKVNYKLIDTVY